MDIREFRDTLRGPLLQPGDAGYDAARQVWNGGIDRKPLLIARCTGPADVISAVTDEPEHQAWMTWGAPKGPPTPPTLRAPAEPWRSASGR